MDNNFYTKQNAVIKQQIQNEYL